MRFSYCIIALVSGIEADFIVDDIVVDPFEESTMPARGIQALATLTSKSIEYQVMDPATTSQPEASIAGIEVTTTEQPDTLTGVAELNTTSATEESMEASGATTTAEPETATEVPEVPTTSEPVTAIESTQVTTTSGPETSTIVAELSTTSEPTSTTVTDTTATPGPDTSTASAEYVSTSEGGATTTTDTPSSAKSVIVNPTRSSGNQNILYSENVVIIQPHQQAPTAQPRKLRKGSKRKIFLDMIRSAYMSYLEEKVKTKNEQNENGTR
jgi:hypothetical protein